MVPRSASLLCGGVLLIVGVLGLMAQWWAVSVNERATELAKEMTKLAVMQRTMEKDRCAEELLTLRSTMKHDDERFGVLQRNFTLEYDSLQSKFSDERAAWLETQSHLLETQNRLEIQAKEKADLYDRCEKQVRPASSDVKLQPKADVADTCRQHCAIVNVGFGYDPRFLDRSFELQQRIGFKHYPTFEELYHLIVNVPYDASLNIWNHFPNAYNMSPSFAFPYSNLNNADLDRVFRALGRPPSFMVEVGSFHGNSAVLTAGFLDQRGHGSVPLLCIDPWVGDMGELLFRDDWDRMTPDEVVDGRSTAYFQFMLNVKSRIDSGSIGPRHIIPLAVTSLVGARYLIALGLTPDVVYLDSAHEKDETFVELSLYYGLLAAGGVLFGDDFSWYSVSVDVKRFAEREGLHLTVVASCWMLQKPH